MHRTIIRSFCNKQLPLPPPICTGNKSDWNEEHATDSETMVKADRHHQQTIQELQDYTIDKIKKQVL